jgi:hypothetical protein
LSFSLSLFLSLCLGKWRMAMALAVEGRRYGNLLLARVYTLKKQAGAVRTYTHGAAAVEDSMR